MNKGSPHFKRIRRCQNRKSNPDGNGASIVKQFNVWQQNNSHQSSYCNNNWVHNKDSDGFVSLTSSMISDDSCCDSDNHCNTDNASQDIPLVSIELDCKFRKISSLLRMIFVFTFIMTWFYICMGNILCNLDPSLPMGGGRQLGSHGTWIDETLPQQMTNFYADTSTRLVTFAPDTRVTRSLLAGTVSNDDTPSASVTETPDQDGGTDDGTAGGGGRGGQDPPVAGPASTPSVPPPGGEATDERDNVSHGSQGSGGQSDIVSFDTSLTSNLLLIISQFALNSVGSDRRAPDLLGCKLLARNRLYAELTFLTEDFRLRCSHKVREAFGQDSGFDELWCEENIPGNLWLVVKSFHTRSYQEPLIMDMFTANRNKTVLLARLFSHPNGDSSPVFNVIELLSNWSALVQIHSERMTKCSEIKEHLDKIDEEMSDIEAVVNNVSQGGV